MVVRIIFENIKNINLGFFDNCSLNLIFSTFSMFFRTKNPRTKRVFPIFFVLIAFKNIN